MFGIFMESLVIFKLYTGLKFLFVLTLAAFVYLLVTEKNKNFRILFVYAPVLILLLFLFPVSRKLFVAAGLDGATYHGLWGLFLFCEAQKDRACCDIGSDHSLRQICVRQ